MAALTSIPLLKPGETLDWVNNQVLPIGDPDELEVEVGEVAPFDGELPDVEIEEPQLKNDPVSGVNAIGFATNNTDEQLERVVVYGVARKDGEIVAAGRAAIEKLNPDRQRPYRIYFIGDPEGAELSVTSFPTLGTALENEGESK